MRVSGKGHESLMVIVPMAVVLCCAVYVMGGPTPLLEKLDRYLGDVFIGAVDWVKALF